MARITGMILGLGLLVVLSSFVSPASAWDSDDDDDHKHKHKRHPHHRYAPPIFVPLDDDDDHYKHRHNRHAAPFGVLPFVPEPIYSPPRYREQYDYPYVPENYPIPQGQFRNDPHNPWRIDFGSPLNQPVPPAPEYPPVPEYQPTPKAPLAPPPLPPEELFGETPSDTITGPRFGSSEPAIPVSPDFRPGQFASVETELYPRVRVEGEDEIPRHAVPQIIAVRSPDPLRFPGLVYVPVRVPPGPCRDLKVKDDGAKIEMNYGDFSVEIVSAKGLVSVEYDN